MMPIIIINRTHSDVNLLFSLPHNKSLEKICQKEVDHRVGWFFHHQCVDFMLVTIHSTKRFPHSTCRRVSPIHNQMQIPLYRFTTKMSISMQNALKTICKQFSFQCGPMNVFVCLLCCAVLCRAPKFVQRINYATEILIQVVGWFAPSFPIQSFFRFANRHNACTVQCVCV